MRGGTAVQKLCGGAAGQEVWSEVLVLVVGELERPEGEGGADGEILVLVVGGWIVTREREAPTVRFCCWS